MRSYRFVNQIDTAGGRTHEYILVVYVEETTFFVEGPPWATMRDALAVQPAAEGNEAILIEKEIRRCANWVERWAPRQWPSTGLLPAGIDASTQTIPVEKVEDWEYEGTIRIQDELITYFGKETETGISTGAGNLTRCLRGQFGTVAATHAMGVTLEDFDYPIKARDAVLSLFRWLWDTAGYKPSRSSEAGSESYDASIDTQKVLVKESMGKYYTGGGRATVVPIPSQVYRPPRRTRSWR
jgi:hypothetical protein